ncbi:MAG: FG-GAP repeat domain-containing protein, partial [Verrucomicrobiales bacterium]
MAQAEDLGTGEAWKRHTIDRSSRGADGVRLGDLNGDGLLDLVSGWEEGGLIRAYLNPGSLGAKQPWSSVTVGRVKSPEDAVFVDLDGDGGLDVVSCCEGKNKTVFVHWAPQDRAKILDESAWETAAIPCAAGEQMWMFAIPLEIDGAHGIDLVVGSKGAGGSISWLQAPENARDLAAWKRHRLRSAA